MNRNRRQGLMEALDKLRKARDIVDRIADEEQESLDNTPENLQLTDRWADMEEALDLLREAIDSMDDAESNISQVAGG